MTADLGDATSGDPRPTPIGPFNVVAPGIILFPGGSWDERLQSDREAVEALIAREVPMGRFGRPEEIAATALLLAGPDGGFYVGATLSPNGGDVMY